MGWPHVLGTFLYQEESLEESLGRGSLHAHVPSGGDTAGVDTPCRQPRGVLTTWGAWWPQLTLQPWATVAHQGGGRPGPLSLPGLRDLSLSGARSRVAGVPTLGPEQQPRAKHHRSPTAHLYAKRQLPIGLRCPPIPTALGVLKGVSPHTQRVPTARAPWPEHHPSSRTTGAKAGPQCAGVPSPRQPPSPSAGCLQVTRRLAMGDFSQLGMKS